MPPRRLAFRIGLGLGALLLLIQLVPYGRDHSDPKATQLARLPNAHGEQLFEHACADCHSDHTNWRWYSSVAPASWLVYNDVKEGRQNLNLSEWDKAQPEVGEIAEQILSGGMPPIQYKLVHPSARLTAKEKRDLIATFGELYAAHPPPVRAGG